MTRSEYLSLKDTPYGLIEFLSAWAEIHDVFGDGHEYDWALEGDDDADLHEHDLTKPEIKYGDVCCSFPFSLTILTYFRYLNPL